MNSYEDIFMAMFDIFKKKELDKGNDIPDIPPLPDITTPPMNTAPVIPSNLPQPPSREDPFAPSVDPFEDPENESMLYPKPDTFDISEPNMPSIPAARKPEPISIPKPDFGRSPGIARSERPSFEFSRPGPEFPRPEPLQMPRPEPAAPKISSEGSSPGLPGPPPLPKRIENKKLPVELPEITPPKRPEITSVKPHLFVKIDKYREVVDSISKLKSELIDIRKTLRDLESLDSQSLEKLKASETITNKIGELVNFFEQSFTAPEE
jgi:hypothetical protein